MKTPVQEPKIAACAAAMCRSDATLFEPIPFQLPNARQQALAHTIGIVLIAIKPICEYSVLQDRAHNRRRAYSRNDCPQRAKHQWRPQKHRHHSDITPMPHIQIGLAETTACPRSSWMRTTAEKKRFDIIAQTNSPQPGTTNTRPASCTHKSIRGDHLKRSSKPARVGMTR
jgi:hypothetical protein